MVPSFSTTNSPLRHGTTRRENFAMAIQHPFAVVDRWSEHGVGDETGYGERARPGPDGRRHIHVEYEDGARVCVVSTVDGVESLSSNRAMLMDPETGNTRLVAHVDPRAD